MVKKDYALSETERMEIQTIDWENIVTNHIPNKGPVSI